MSNSSLFINSSEVKDPINLNEVTNKINKIVNEIYEYATVKFTTEQMIKCDTLIKEAGWKFCVSKLENKDGTISEDWFELFKKVVKETKINFG